MITILANISPKILLSIEIYSLKFNLSSNSSIFIFLSNNSSTIFILISLELG